MMKGFPVMPSTRTAFSVHIKQQSSVCVLDVRGELEISTVDSFQPALEAALSATGAVVIDLCAVTFLAAGAVVVVLGAVAGLTLASGRAERTARDVTVNVRNADSTAPATTPTDEQTAQSEHPRRHHKHHKHHKKHKAQAASESQAS